MYRGPLPLPMVVETLHLKLPEVTLEWLPTVASEHKDKKQKPAPLSVDAWVFEQLKQVAVNQGHGVNLLKSKGYIEFKKQGETENSRLVVDDLKLDDYLPKDKREGENYRVKMPSTVMGRLQWVVALLNAYGRAGMMPGNETFDDVESWAEDQLTRTVASAYTEVENRKLEEAEVFVEDETPPKRKVDDPS